MGAQTDGAAACRSRTSRAAAREAERELILRMLTGPRWNRKEAAEILGISYKALLYKIKEKNGRAGTQNRVAFHARRPPVRGDGVARPRDSRRASNPRIDIRLPVHLGTSTMRANGGTPLIGLAWHGSDLGAAAPLTVRRGSLGRVPVTRDRFRSERLNRR